jgi:hypothetical protein
MTTDRYTRRHSTWRGMDTTRITREGFGGLISHEIERP